MVDKEPTGITQEEIDKIKPNLSSPEELAIAIFGFNSLARDYIDELLARSKPPVVEQLPYEKIAEATRTIREKIFSPLNPFESEVVDRRLGLLDGQATTFTAIGQELGRDRRVIGRVFRGALEKLRQAEEVRSTLLEP